MRTLTARHRSRGFTLLEILLVVVIITILAALLFVAVGAAVRTVRRASEEQYIRSLATAVEQYKQSVGVVPPLVANGATANDGPLLVSPPAGQHVRSRLKGEGAGDLARATRFLRYEVDADVAGDPPPVSRYSEYTLPVYVLGVLGKKYDGVDGPGFTKPDSEGVFSRMGSVTQPLFDVSRDTGRLRRDPRFAGTSQVGNEDDPACRHVLVDRWNNPIRYYCWLPTYHKTGVPTPSVYPGVPSNVVAQAKEIRSFNVPPGVGNPATNPELRSAKCAIVSAGPDGLINDVNASAPENKDNIVEVVQ